MSWVAVAVGGGVAVGAVAGGIMSSNAAGDAADKQQQAANYATDMQWKMYQQQRDDTSYFRRSANDALGQMMEDSDYRRDFGAADFQKDPGYDFRMQEGQKALEASAAARGGLMSGNFATAMAQYGQNFASNEYQNAYNRFNADRDRRFNRFASIAGLGQTGNSQVGAAGQNAANQIGQNMMGAANAQGAAGIASANAWSNSLSSLGRTGVDIYSANAYRNRPQPATQPVTPGAPTS